MLQAERFVAHRFNVYLFSENEDYFFKKENLNLRSARRHNTVFSQFGCALKFHIGWRCPFVGHLIFSLNNHRSQESIHWLPRYRLPLILSNILFRFFLKRSIHGCSHNRPAASQRLLACPARAMRDQGQRDPRDSAAGAEPAPCGHAGRCGGEGRLGCG